MCGQHNTFNLGLPLSLLVNFSTAIYGLWGLSSLVSGENNVSDGASSRDGQDAQATSSRQLQQHDTVETFRQKYLSSGKFHFNLN